MEVSSARILATLILCGLMGVLGQGVRAIVGLKNAGQTQLAGLPGQQNVFDAAYLLVSLMIGMIAGVLSGIGIGLGSLMTFHPDDIKVLLGIAAAGYAGADFVENAFSGIIPGLGAPPSPVQPGSTALSFVGPTPATVPPPAAGEIQGLRAALRVAAPRVNVDVWTPALSAAFNAHGLNSHRQMAAAIGQFLVEAGASLQDTIEDLTYTHAERIHAVFPSRIPTVADAQRFVGQPELLGNFVYANRNGNGDVASGDGFRFRGRGLIQLTGRATYAAFAKTLGKTPEEVLDDCASPKGAAMSGCWFLAAHNCLTLADNWEISAITHIINPKGEGAAQRLSYSEAVLKALGG